MMSRPPPIESLWDARDVARHIKSSVSWVYKAAERGEVPCVRLGAMLRFNPASVRTWLQSRFVAVVKAMTHPPRRNSQAT